MEKRGGPGWRWRYCLNGGPWRLVGWRTGHPGREAPLRFVDVKDGDEVAIEARPPDELGPEDFRADFDAVFVSQRYRFTE